MISNWLQLSERTKIGQQVYKNVFYTQDFFKSQEQEIFTQDVEKIIWANAIKPDTVLLESVDNGEEKYKEVQFFEVCLKSVQNIDKIHSLLQRSIAFPLIILFHFDDTLALGGALKSYSLEGKVKKTEETLLTQLQTEQHYQELKQYFSNKHPIKTLKEYYLFIYDGLKAQNLQEKTQNFRVDNALDARKQKLVEKEKLEKEIENLKKKLSKESNISKKVTLGLELRRLQDKLKNYS